jgi:hypothetical protein
MAATATITAIDTSGPGVIFTLGKRGYRFPSLAAARDYVQDRISQVELAELVAMAEAIRAQPGLGNPSVLLNHGVTVDLTKVNIVTAF